MIFFDTIATGGCTHLWLGCDKHLNCRVLAMAMVDHLPHVLVSKYRYKIFYNKKVKKDCESIFKNICAEKGYRIQGVHEEDRAFDSKTEHLDR